MKTILVTGGAGFIGSNFVRWLLSRTDAGIVVVDKLTYAGNKASLKDVETNPRFEFVKADIADEHSIVPLIQRVKPDAIFNLAAETHVDRSIEGPRAFLETNVLGTFVLLEAARRYLEKAKNPDDFRFIQISTDEVYGSLGPEGAFSETTPYAPNSPYSASKAGADHLARAYFETYRLPVIVTNCSNNYGPYQFPEKLIPLMVLNALEGKSLPIYGDGGNVRDWLFVEDHCSALVSVLQKGVPGEKYNVGGGAEQTNLQLVDKLCQFLQDIQPAEKNPALESKNIKRYSDLKTFVKDRPGHDRRYAIDSSKIRNELGWKPDHDFDGGLRKTLRWYVENRTWCETVQSGNYSRERLGLKAAGKELH